MKKRLYSLTLLIGMMFITGTSVAQDPIPQAKNGFGDRIYFGGDLGLQFGNITFVDISPLVGYRITDQFSVGVGGIYQYINYNFDGFQYETSVYGGRGFSRFNITNEIFLHGEYGMINWETWDRREINNFELKRITVPFLLAGGGYRYQLGNNVYFSTTLLFDLIQDLNSPFVNPVLRGGIIIGG